MGFLLNPSTGAPFQGNPPLPVFWDLLTTSGNIQAFGGGGTDDQKFSVNGGVQGSLYSISLEKTDSSGDYTYSYSGPGITTTTYTKNIGSNTITSIGFGLPQGAQSDVVDNFTLSSNSVPVGVPEPSTWAMLLGGMMLLLALQRRSWSQA